MKVLIGLAIVAFMLYGYLYVSGKRADKKFREELEAIRLGENYRQLVTLTYNQRQYTARVRRWNIPEIPGVAELWCTEGPNPNGWTDYFMWPHKEMKFL